MLGTLAAGTSRIRGLAAGADVRSTAEALRALGVATSRLPEGDESLELSGPVTLESPSKVIDCGNSGTTARLLLGLVAGRSITAVLDGDASLRRRPMRRVLDPLAAAGAVLREMGEPGRLPVEVSGGALRPIEHRTPVASAQVTSALLLAGVAAGVPVTVLEPGPSRDHTELMLRAMDGRVETAKLDSGWQVRFEPAARPLQPLRMTVPGDFSSAAFWIALAVLGCCGEGVRIEKVGLNPRRTGFLRALQSMGALVEERIAGDEGGEPVGDVVARPSALRGIEVPVEWLPTLLDEIPVLAALAARAEGVTVIRGAEELRVKESDRIATLHRNLGALGVRCREWPDGLEVEGTSSPLSGQVVTEGDHRIAMAFGVLGATRGSQLAIDNRASVEISYPGFWDELARAVDQTEAR